MGNTLRFLAVLGLGSSQAPLEHVHRHPSSTPTAQVKGRDQHRPWEYPRLRQRCAYIEAQASMSEPCPGKLLPAPRRQDPLELKHGL